MVELRLCGCGSGLRALRCCEQNLAYLPQPGAAEPLAPMVDEALAAFGRRDVATAESLCLKILELAPAQPQALRLLHDVRKADAPRAAEALIRRLVALYPNDFSATNELTLLLIAKGDLAEAELHARNAVRIAPEEPQSHHLMGMILTEANRPHFAEYHYLRAVELADHRNAILLANFAWNQKSQGKMAEARRLYAESLALAPDLLPTALGLARLEEADRKFEAAGALLDRAERLAPGDPSVLLSRAVLFGRMKRYDRALATLDDIAGRRAEGELGPNELLEKGRLLDRMGHADEAFAAFDKGKAMIREMSGRRYLADEAADLAARLKGFFTASRLAILPRAGVVAGAAKPIFIVGFPRSGTTLVEQMLSAHPSISAGDELPFVNDIAGMMPRMLNSPLAYPEALTELWMGDQRAGLDNLRDYYLQRAAQAGALAAGKPWFTDKMPLNETHLGLIAMLFPGAPLIHIIRHPLDVVLSVFSNQLTHGFYCAYALDSIARHYALVRDLVDHYLAQMPLNYLAIRYEDIVTGQEASMRRILDFIGEPFDRRCLHFEDNSRYARTASYAQVTERLYDRSRYRYRRYLQHLAPVLPLLEPIIRRLGYDASGEAA